jgi:hypothetical protein
VGSIPISRREGGGYCIKVVLQFCVLEVQVRVLISPFGAQARRNILSPLISASATFFADEV